MYNDTLNGSTEKKSSELPDAVGPIVQLQEKLYVPVKEYPDFNFVGRILGPRGLTAKQLEAETGCKIMVRGKGSMRDKKKVSASWACCQYWLAVHSCFLVSNLLKFLSHWKVMHLYIFGWSRWFSF
ncbi:hypothetical protein Z043_101586 [Scleropages formosus]|uniref:K Homology domain-containing protein n=1 Tax=Scleropages formosus TaxID=113540 RepID=A0A0P7V9J4_SCLFO|nr:hypothetical protein Z043_101586 [Scleropages formosus]